MVGNWNCTKNAPPVLSPEQFMYKVLLLPCTGLVVLYHHVVGYLGPWSPLLLVILLAQDGSHKRLWLPSWASGITNTCCCNTANLCSGPPFGNFGVGFGRA